VPYLYMLSRKTKYIKRLVKLLTKPKEHDEEIAKWIQSLKKFVDVIIAPE